MLTYKKDDFDENLDDIMNSVEIILKNKKVESDDENRKTDEEKSEK